MKRFWLAALLAVCLASFVHAGDAEEIVSVRVLPSDVALKAGRSHELVLEVLIRPPYHINSASPLEAYLIPTTVEFETAPGAEFGKAVFPDAPLKRMRFSENPLAVYEGTIRIVTPVALAPDFRGGELSVKGRLGYQACDDQSCLAPAEAAFSGAYAVESAAAEKAETKEARSGSAPEPASAAAVARAMGTTPASAPGGGSEAAARESRTENARGGETAPFGQKGLPLTFLLVFLGGLALNLTPCVYPLIPITISYFGGQTPGRKGSVARHSAVYVIGMAVTYSALGVAAAFTGSLFGSALQHPPVLVGIAAVMIALALSMFNVYELRLPSFLVRLSGGPKKGYGGTFLMGLTVGVVAAPCIGPFVLGLLTYVGNKGSVLLGFALFFVLALGLGIPFLFLGIFSGSLSRLPRSGAWMVWVRTIFGFVLIGMAVYFLKPLFPNPLLYGLTLALTMIVGGVYMAWIEPTKTPGKAFTYVRNLAGVFFFAAGLLAATGGIQGYLDESLAEKIAAAGIRGPEGAAGVRWQPWSEAKLEEAARTNTPVFIDFYADWCLPCKELDRNTFSQPEFLELSREFVMLKADMTKGSDPLSKRLEARYKIRGVPTLVFLTPDGAELTELRTVGFENKDVFLPKMRRALEAGRKSSAPGRLSPGG